MSVTADELAELAIAPIYRALEGKGITPDYLATKLKRELNAKKTDKIKLKGHVLSVPKGFRIICRSESTHLNGKDGDGPIEVQDAEETLVVFDLIDWATRQKARIDAHKLLGHYPAEKHEIDHKGNLAGLVYGYLDNEQKE